MTTQTPTLTAFLLERIAHDEAAARKLAETDRRPVLSLAETINHPERLLAECEAKRRIVEGRSGVPHPEDGCDGSCDGPNDHWAKVDEWEILTYLAAVYAGHPDYREEWKP
jgi:hypothetical protein